jgi:hypothetical protein
MVARGGNEVSAEDIESTKTVTGDKSELVEDAAGVDRPKVSGDPGRGVGTRPPKLCLICGASSQESHIAVSHRLGLGR